MPDGTPHPLRFCRAEAASRRAGGAATPVQRDDAAGGGESRHSNSDGVQSVFPRDSEHRLAWWRARWNHQQRRQNTILTGGRSIRRTGGEPGLRPEGGGHDE
jgi:hypothetical protein